MVGQELEARLSKMTAADVQSVASRCHIEDSCLVKAIAHKKCVTERSSRHGCKALRCPFNLATLVRCNSEPCSHGCWAHPCRQCMLLVAK